MTAATLTLAEFLEQRIEADEAVARAAIRDQMQSRTIDDGHWSVGDHPMDACRIEGLGIDIYDEGGHTPEQAQHIARHDPARVLAECAAKRRMVELLVYYMEGDYAPWNQGILQTMVSVWSDHPDFDSAWLS